MNQRVSEWPRIMSPIRSCYKAARFGDVGSLENDIVDVSCLKHSLSEEGSRASGSCNQREPIKARDYGEALSITTFSNNIAPLCSRSLYLQWLSLVVLRIPL